MRTTPVDKPKATDSLEEQTRNNGTAAGLGLGEAGAGQQERGGTSRLNLDRPPDREEAMAGGLASKGSQLH